MAQYNDIVDDNSDIVGTVRATNGPVEGMIELMLELEGSEWVIHEMKSESTGAVNRTWIVLSK
jgi:hypothetical protein